MSNNENDRPRRSSFAEAFYAESGDAYEQD